MSTEGTSRLAAVWYAEFEGSSRGIDDPESEEAGSAAALHSVATRECSSRGGRLAELDGGLVGLFGTVDDALATAFAVSEAWAVTAADRGDVGPLRAGLHFGGVSEGARGLVRGEALDVAVALARAREGSGVVISDMAFRLLQDRSAVEVEDRGEHRLPGMESPLRFYTASPPAETSAVDVRARLQEALAPLQLLDMEGFGGMGEIYLARDPALRRTLAVKVLRAELAGDEASRARFFREAQVIAGLSHPNVISIHSVGQLDDGEPWFVMDYVEGGSLADRLEAEGPLSVTEAGRVLGEVASALQAAHGRGVVHRDIKASNILWDADTGRALVTDWGIAALDPSVEMTPETRLTRTGAVIGSPQYMSPEQLAGDEVGPETDMYSLGLLAFELLTGQGPFEAETPRAIMVAHLRDDAPVLSSARDDVGPELDAMVARCLAKNPGERPTAEEIVRRLKPETGPLLEWPPPGLDHLQGRLPPLVRLVGVASSLVVLPVLLVMQIGAPATTDFFSPVQGLSFLVVLVALTLVLPGLIGGLSLARDVGAALDGGYAWGTILEMVSDVRGDTGAVMAGLREYASLSHEERGRLRRYRVRVAAWTLLAAVLPVPMLIGLFGLATRGWLLIGSWWLAVVPSVVLMLMARRDVQTEGRLVAEGRLALARGRAGRERLESLAPAWYGRFDEVRTGGQPGRGPKGRRVSVWVLAGAGALGLIALVLAMLPIAFVWVMGGMYLEIWLPKFADVRDSLEPGELARPYRVLMDSSVSPEEAGRLFGVLAGGNPAAPEWVVEPDSTFPAVFPQPTCTDAFGRPEPGGSWEVRLIQAASREPLEFTEAELECLRRLSAYAGWSVVARLATAPAMDHVGTYYRLPFPEAGTYYAMPIPRFRELRNLTYAARGVAALDVLEGRPAEAERRFREIASLGLLMMDGAPNLIVAHMGRVVAVNAVEGLESLHRVTGEVDQAARIVQARDSLEAVHATRAELSSRINLNTNVLRPAWIRSQLLSMARDTTFPRGVRWEAASAADILRCSNLREYVFGLGEDARAARDQARSSLVRFPSEDAMFDLLERGELDHDLVALYRDSGIPTPLPARSPVVRGVISIGERLMGTPSLMNCFLVMDLINVVY